MNRDVFTEIEKYAGIVVDVDYRSQYIALWKDWYEGEVPGFHNYTQQVMGTTKSFSRKTLNPAKKCAKAWADILTREFPVVTVADNLQERFNAFMDKENVEEELVKYIEHGFALGTSCLVEYIVDGEAHIDFLTVHDIVPLSYKNGVVSELATVNVFNRDDMIYTHIQYNRTNGNDYIIENQVFVSDDENDIGTEIDSELIGITDLYIKNAKPFFQVIRPNIANSIDIDSPLGMSIFHDAIDTCESIDSKYTEFDKEFCLGRKRLIVSSDALNKKLDPDTGQFISYLGNDDIYQAINREGESLFEVFDPILREQSYINGLNQDFNFLADSVGMDAGTFIFNGVSMKTATEVYSEKSKTFGNKRKHDKMLESVLKDMAQAVIKIFGIIDGVEYDNTVEVHISDNVLIDDTAYYNDMRIDVQSNLVPKSQYIMEKYGLSYEDALAWMKRINEEQGTVDIEALQSMFGG